MTRVFAYLRVSGRLQLDGDGFTRQLEAVTHFAESKGWTIARTFREEAVSGTVESRERPAFTEMLSLCGGGQFNTIVVERCDRLARDLIISELLFEECRKLGVKVFSADSGEELVNADSDPTRKLIRQVLGALAEWDKSVTVKKLRAARGRIRKEKGRCEGIIPLEITHPEIVKEFLRLRKKGLSYREITRYFNYEKRIPTPESFRSRRWNSSTLHQIHARLLTIVPAPVFVPVFAPTLASLPIDALENLVHQKLC